MKSTESEYDHLLEPFSRLEGIADRLARELMGKGWSELDGTARVQLFAALMDAFMAGEQSARNYAAIAARFRMWPSQARRRKEPAR